jgi:hypothetical protein
MVGGSTATIEGVRIERTLPAPGGTFGGRALNVQLDALSQRRGDAQLRYSHIADSADAAVFVGDGTLSVQASVIDQTQASDGLFGDGVVAVTIDLPSVLVIQGSRVSGSVRAGLSVFGSALTLSDSAMSCNGIDIAAEPHEAFTADLTDAGGNRCGCASDEVCRAISAQLAPPEPTDVLE